MVLGLLRCAVLTVHPDCSVERVVYVAGNHQASASRRAVLMIVSSHDGHLLRLPDGATSILAIDRARVDLPENLDSSLSKSGTAT